MDKDYQLGIDGEKQAAEYLRTLGYEILDERWHLHHLEIDIVALDPDSHELAFVEVKTRSTTEFGAPEDAVDYKKIMRLVRAADAYIKQKFRTEEWRFDIISIVAKSGQYHIDHIKDAFYPPLG
ncbi:MAG: YraN family protein [Bacteroidales bacterium]|nr:YraN family protein [Candidatus Liminaster caballi]